MEKMSSVSVVIPAYNEEKNIETLISKAVEALESLKINFQIIIVDDGSEDNTFSVIEKFAGDKEEIVAVKHSYRKGKSMALRSGFEKAKGEAVVMMDADLQYDPQEIPRLLKPLKKGYDVVNGYRDFTKYDPNKVVLSRIYNKLSSRLLGATEIHDLNSGFKAFSKEVVQDLLKRLTWWRGIHRHLISFCTDLGYHITEVNVSLRQRTQGSSKYGLKRILEGILVLIIVFIEVRILTLKKHTPCHRWR